MPPVAPSILQTVGRTPLVRLQRIIPRSQARVLVKCEFFNPLASVKDRIGKAMVEAAEQRVSKTQLFLEREF